MILKIFFKEIRQLCIQVITGVSAIDTVVAVCIELHIELLVQLYQMFCIFCTVLEMNIVIRHSMYQQ